MNIRLFIFVLLIFTGLYSQAQECEYTPSKTIQKTLSKITDPKGKLKSEEKIVKVAAYKKQEDDAVNPVKIAGATPRRAGLASGGK